MLTSSRDNWERLVAAVLKKQQIWELCHQNSISTIASDDLSELTLTSFSGSNLEPFSVPPSPLLPPKIPSNSQVSKSASSRPITRNLFSALYRKMKLKDKAFVGIPEDVVNHLGQLRKFSIEELRIATRDFSKKIGWAVYRGTLANGFPVAVRKQKRFSYRDREFRREVEINSIVAHPNVIRIIGFCITPTKLLLVYPLMVNGSVASCILDMINQHLYRDASQPPLNWATRKGVARAVTYLHEEICDKKIMHCGICPANILLDDDFEAVLADFGVAITAEHDTRYVNVDNIYGGARYFSPEYLQTFRISDKDDVYCYGIFLLVLISGQKTYDQNGIPNIKDRVKSLCMESKWEVIVDPNCASNYMEDEVKPLVQIGLLCSLHDPEKRPKMSEVVKMIEDGDGLAERWEEWLKKEKELIEEEERELQKEKEKAPRNNIYDDTCDLVAEEFSEPR